MSYNEENLGDLWTPDSDDKRAGITGWAARHNERADRIKAYAAQNGLTEEQAAQTFAISDGTTSERDRKAEELWHKKFGKKKRWWQ